MSFPYQRTDLIRLLSKTRKKYRGGKKDVSMEGEELDYTAGGIYGIPYRPFSVFRKHVSCYAEKTGGSKIFSLFAEI